MPPLELNEATVKRLFKEALVETLYEHRSLLREVVAGVLEDAGRRKRFAGVGARRL